MYDVFGKVTPVDDAHMYMYWTHGCGWGLWGSGQRVADSRTDSGSDTADPTQHLPADAVADLWLESTD